MKAVWLAGNRRFWVPLGGLLLAVALAAGSLALGWWPWQPAGWAAAGLAGVAVAAAGLLVCVLAWAMQPRVAYAEGHVLLYLRPTGPVRVPVEVVECFLLGQGPTFLPGEKSCAAEARTVVVRLAESAAEWHRVPVHRLLASWCDGYVTIRGAWCEPLSVDLVRQMNHHLAEVHRAQRRAREANQAAVS